MRVLGFSEMWPKLQKPDFTTFRFPRKDKDWYVGEVVQVVFKPRSKERQVLGAAEIEKCERREVIRVHPKYARAGSITDIEAQLDGFGDKEAMESWLIRVYGYDRLIDEPMNKLTLRWCDGTD